MFSVNALKAKTLRYFLFFFTAIFIVQVSVSFVRVNAYTSQTQKNDLFAPKYKKSKTQMICSVKRYI